jgi:hypothetical protein
LNIGLSFRVGDVFEKTPLHSLRSEGIAKSIAETETHRDALHKSMSHRLTKLGGILRLDSWKTSSGAGSGA